MSHPSSSLSIELAKGRKPPGSGQTGGEAGIDGRGAARHPAQRLPRVERRAGCIEGRLDALQEELRPNGGQSIKDQVNRIAQAAGADKPEMR